MNKLIVFLLLLTLRAYSSVNKSIYGVDNRFDYYEIQNHQFLELANSVAALINAKQVKDNGDGSVTLEGITYGETLNFCEEEKFTEQPSISTCSGFLIAPNLLATAGHCLFERKCEEQAVVFNYHAVNESNYRTTMDEDDIYYCKEVVLLSYSFFEPDDYAIIKLDRPVENKIPLKIRNKGKLMRGTPVMAIGHPMGLPKKFSLNGEVKRVNQDELTFQSNLDLLGGSSGGPVINRETFEVEGIVASGPIDYERDAELGCFRSSRYNNDDEGTWGKSTSIEYIRRYLDSFSE